MNVITKIDQEEQFTIITLSDVLKGKDGRDGIDGKDALINGYNTVEIIAGDNVSIEQVGNRLKINSDEYDDTDIKTELNSLNIIVDEHDKDITNIDNEIEAIKEDITLMEEDMNYLDEIKANKSEIPTKVSQLQNDSNYATKSEIPDVSQFITKGVNDLVNYYLKSDTYTKTEVNELVGAIKTISMKVVPERPQVGETNIIYLVPSAKQEPENIYDEYIYVDNKWEKIGSTEIDLSNYVKNTDFTKDGIAGLVKANWFYGLGVNSGAIYARDYDYDTYQRADTHVFIGKQTLENVISGKYLATKQDIKDYVDSLNANSIEY